VKRSTLSVPLLSAAAAVLASFAPAQTSLISLSTSGLQTDAGSLYPEITPDGRFIAYQSAATNLVPGDTNAVPDVFLRDRLNATTIRVSVGSLGQEGDKGGLEPSISADGRYVAFYSASTNLVPGDTNAAYDIFVRDVQAGTTVRASVDSTGAQGDGGSRYSSISADGRYVAFESAAGNLVPGDTNGVRDVFVHDLLTGSTVLASVDAAGLQGNGESVDASISPDGRFVAFESAASNFVPGDTNGVQDVFVKDLQTGAIVRVSVDSAGLEGDGASFDASISSQGLFVSFASQATNLVPVDTNYYDDVFVHDLTTGTTVRASVSSSGGQAHTGAYDSVITPDGRFVAFFSGASNLVPGDFNSSLDIFVRDLVNGTTERVSLGSAGQQGDGHCFYPAISADGRLVAFDSYSDNIVLGDANGTRDIFLRDRASTFHLFCFGDGTQSTPCPCGNAGATFHGCENSSGTGGGTLEASGPTSPDSVRLNATGERPTALSIFLQGDASVSGGTVYGDGVRCTGGQLKRLFVKNASGGAVCAPAQGDPSITARSSALGAPIPPGATRFYQVYYRDPTATFCPNETFNVTNGVRVGW
jgi:Tol biopolymer transport system component